jgi:nitrate/nitrite transport system substrate-binding protein
MEPRLVSDQFNPPPLEFEKHHSECHCGDSGTAHVHDAAWGAPTPVKSTAAEEQHIDRAVETTVLKTLFPKAAMRRNLLKAVGAGTLLSAIGQHFPLAAAQSIAKEGPKPEKSKLTLGFVPITCTVPMLLAQARGEYGKEGLNVNLVRTPGWPLVRDHLISGNYDASHLVLAMPLTMSMGVGSNRVKTYTSIVQNINGDALAMHVKHKDKRDPKSWKGFKFAVPFEYSMHNFLLRYYVAEAGLNPDTDIQIRVVPPPEMVANLRAGNIDGFLGPDPFNQRAVFEEVGFIHLLTKELWNGHPCCAFGTSSEFIRQNPNTFAALFRSVLTAAAMARQPKNRELIAKVIAPQAYLNQPETVLAQVLTGKFADGLGKIQNVPDRADFDPMPWQSMAVWMLTQMQRWGYIKGNVDYKQIAEKVFLLTDARKHMKDLDMPLPAGTGYAKHTIMGKVFDPAKPQEYLDSFAIRKS